jgi:hypothetical protein
MRVNVLSAPAIPSTVGRWLAGITPFAALTAFIAFAVVVARGLPDFVLFVLTLPLFLSPGWPIATWYAGSGFDQALGRHGAPPRAVVAQPIRWVRKPAATAAPRDAR